MLIKIDLGKSSRFGVFPGKEVLKLAQKLHQLTNIEFAGIYGHEMGAKPTQNGRDEAAFEAATIMSENAKMLAREGIAVEHVSVGASPTFRSTCRYMTEGKFPEITEIHPGQCVIGDVGYMKMGGNTEDTIAVTVLTMVMSTSHSEWAMIDAGYKTFGADAMIAHRDTPGFFWEGKPSFGNIKGHSGLWFGRLSAETGSIYYKDPGQKLHLGQRLEIVPNNSTLVINIHDRIYGVRNGVVELEIPVTARGRGN
jgi:D-serine deaminase-like pyridoxal phosphate-dependent protein